MKTLQALQEAISRRNSLVCCGLDPDYGKLPQEIVNGPGSKEEQILKFLQEIVDLTNTHVCAYKAQKAFFDLYPNGHWMLKETISYIHRRYPTLPVFVDAKIGDTENTMEAYLRDIFDELGADGVVVNPYLGDEVLTPFESLPDKAAIVTVKTSNPGGAVVQDILVAGNQKLWVYILETMISRWNKAHNLIPVISSTADESMAFVREIIPDDMPILFAGFGAQGGTTEHLRELLNSGNAGVFVNSSRGILYPYKSGDPEWRDKVVHSVISMKADLNAARGVSNQKFLLLLGPSGVGKSAIMRELIQLDSRFAYISPFMTRELRSGESDKVSVSNAELDELDRQGKILAINDLYGVCYATPREPIDKEFAENRFPLLDWPVHNTELMLKAFPGKTFMVFVEPPDVGTLGSRLANGRDPERQRYNAAVNELQTYYNGDYDDVVDWNVINAESKVRRTAEKIHNMYLTAIGERH